MGEAEAPFSGAAGWPVALVGGAGAAVATSMFYYPSRERTVKNGFRNWGLDIGYDSVTFMFHEFWPDISYALFAKKPKKAPPVAATP